MNVSTLRLTPLATRLLCTSVLLGSSLALLPTTAQAQFNPNVWYRMTTQFRGAGQALDVINGGPNNNEMHLQPAAAYTGQYWRIIPFGPAAPGYFRISCLFRGTALPMDIFNGGSKNNQPHLAKEGPYTGQAWKFTEVPQAAGYYRLTTLFRGPGMSLDIFNGGSLNNRPHLAKTGLYSGQLWKFTPIISVGTGSTKPFGTGCAGAAGVHSMTTNVPNAGRTFNCTVSNIAPTARASFLFGLRYPNSLDLAFLGSPGCSLYMPIQLTIRGTRAGSSYRLALPLPKDPSLVSVKVDSQAFVTDPGRPARPFSTSNAVALVVGMR